MILFVVITGLGVTSSAYAAEHTAGKNNSTIQVEIGDEIDEKGLRPIIESPLKQFKSGVLATDIICKDGLYPLQKYDGSPACVKTETRYNLLLREWSILTVSKTTFNHYRIDCNNQSNPYQEYECFKEAFSKCLHAFVDPEIYTTEGDPDYRSLRVTSDCKIEALADLKDEQWSFASITTTCDTLDRDEYSWSVKNCDFEKFSEMKFNFMMQLQPKILECKQNGNAWNNETMNCVVSKTN